MITPSQLKEAQAIVDELRATRQERDDWGRNAARWRHSYYKMRETFLCEELATYGVSA